MTMRPRFAAALVVAALLGLAVPFLAACGGSDKLLPADQATALDQALQQVADGTASGDCQAAVAALKTAQNAYADLPSSTDPRLKARLGDGIAQLAKTVPTQCRANKPQTTTTTAPTTSTTTTPTTTSTTTTPTTTTTTTPTTTTTTPTTTTTTENPGGISPDGQGAPGTTGATP